MEQKISRKQAILQVLAGELERTPGGRITTAALARAAGVSEAALYRHFASKAKMFEGLIGFAEEAVFSRVNQIMEDEKNSQARCARLIYLLLAFADRNPGITRILTGDALVGENERLQSRVGQFFDRVETQFRQILREAGMREGRSASEVDVTASLLLALVEGRLQRFLRSRFKHSPLQDWERQWERLAPALFGV